MKTNFFVRYFLICGLFLLFFSTAQSQTNFPIHLKGGIAVAVKSELKSENSKALPIESVEVTNENESIVHRILPDSKNRIYFGYDLQVIRESEPHSFRIIIKPLSIDIAKFFPEYKDFVSRPLPRYPNPITVKAKDTVEMEFLTNSQTGERIAEYLKVDSYSTSSGAVTAYATDIFIGSFSDLKETRDFSLDDVTLKLKSFEIFADGKKVGQMSGGGWGANIYFTLPGKGRFIFSPFERKGYDFKKIGAVIDNRMSFTYEGVKYEVVSKDAILGESGNWYVWVLYDPKYEWTANPKMPLSIQFGSADKIDYFFGKPY
jgi:hypothetical protein